MTSAKSAQSASGRQRIPVLDGWRAVSILLVLGAHLLPLGPKAMELNFAAGAMGMALFFTLSGFLIVSFLSDGAPLGAFMAKRLARIVPLCWLAIAVLATWRVYDADTLARNLLFVANLPPADLLHGGEHLWSLGVEMQFYVLAAALCLVLGRKGLLVIPLLALAVTTARIAAGETISIVTWHRVDEILAGGTLALIVSGRLGEGAREWLMKVPFWPAVLFLLVASHPAFGPLQYLRPYAAALLVGSSLRDAPVWIEDFLTSRPMAYIAEVSYALYVIHGVLSATWLGEGNRTEKYLKRPLLFAATFALAHLSTFYFEKPINGAVRRTRGEGIPRIKSTGGS
ncbi:acyltransferase family protein [Sphingomonas arenae]|uniref:acyltransferase family protein n=1 Tax=Sphingomonas arenae TaxID=2812555 RepID=UPI001967B14A|nr:acyltransferase [Sphingomonas arenae]